MHPRRISLNNPRARKAGACPPPSCSLIGHRNRGRALGSQCCRGLGVVDGPSGLDALRTPKEVDS